MAWTIFIPDRLAEAIGQAFERLQSRGSLRYSKRSEMVRDWIAERVEKEIGTESDSE